MTVNGIFFIEVNQEDKIKQKAQKLYYSLLSIKSEETFQKWKNAKTGCNMVSSENKVNHSSELLFAFLKIFHETKQLWFCKI